MAARWPLFGQYPELAHVLAPIPLCTLPTPVEPLPLISPHAFIKRDDVTHPVYGGNKMRKLEVIVADWERKGARRIVTFGANGTSSGVAASMIAKERGVECTVLTFDQPPSSTVERNAAAMIANGADVVRVGALFWTALAWYAHPRRLDPRTYFLFAGCSNPVAVFAYVNAAFELRAQIDEGACPLPTEIVVAAGTAATLAGLTLGCALAKLSTRVIGIRTSPSRVGPFASCTTGVATSLMRGCADAIERITQRSIDVVIPAPVLLDAWYGDGYGAPTAAGVVAAATLARAGVPLEQTYTGKAFAAFLARLPNAGGDALFWNTFSSR